MFKKVELFKSDTLINYEVASKFIVMNDEGGQLSGLKSGDHIWEKTLPTLHSAAFGYLRPSVLKGISIRWHPTSPKAPVP